MRLGFIGFGEAGFELAFGLDTEGLKNKKAYDPILKNPKYKELIRKRAQKANVELFDQPEGVLKGINILIVAVPADKALEVSQQLIPLLNNEILYIDVSASKPEVKKQISINIKKCGAKFVDAAMMGPLPVYKHKVPILASGNGTDQFITLMSKFNMNIRKVSDIPGDATAVKLIRSIYMKGIVGLYIELLEAAQHFNVEKLVIDSLSETINGKTFEETMNRLVTGTAIHAKRRSYELTGTIDLLKSANIDSSMSKAAKDKIEKLSLIDFKEIYRGKKPENWQQVISDLKLLT